MNTRAATGRRLLPAAAVAVLLIAVVSIGLAVADYFDVSLDPRTATEFLNQRPYVAGVALLGLEEAGVPLPISGDFLLVYSAATVPREPYALVALWAAFEIVVLIGSSVLFAVAQRWGRRLVTGRIGYALHLTPARLARAEGWFHRWGIWAVIFGRHVPGFRITTTVVAAVFGVSYPVFVLGIAITAGVWLVFWMWVGVTVGPTATEVLGAHRYGSLLVLGGVVLLGTLYVLVRLALQKRA